MLKRRATLLRPMSRWHCAWVTLLAGCVDLTAPPGVSRPVDGSAIDVEIEIITDAAPIAPDAGIDTAQIEIDAAADAAQMPDLPPEPEPDASPPDLPLVMNGRPCSA